MFWEGEWLPVRNAVQATRLWYRDQLVVGCNNTLDGAAKGSREALQGAVKGIKQVDAQMKQQKELYPVAFPACALSGTLIATWAGGSLAGVHFPKTTAVLCTSLAAIWFYPQQYAKFAFTPLKVVQGVVENPLSVLEEAGKEKK